MIDWHDSPPSRNTRSSHFKRSSVSSLSKTSDKIPGKKSPNLKCLTENAISWRNALLKSKNTKTFDEAVKNGGKSVSNGSLISEMSPPLLRRAKSQIVLQSTPLERKTKSQNVFIAGKIDANVHWGPVVTTNSNLLTNNNNGKIDTTHSSLFNNLKQAVQSRSAVFYNDSSSNQEDSTALSRSQVYPVCSTQNPNSEGIMPKYLLENGLSPIAKSPLVRRHSPRTFVNLTSPEKKKRKSPCLRSHSPLQTSVKKRRIDGNSKTIEKLSSDSPTTSFGKENFFQKGTTKADSKTTPILPRKNGEKLENSSTNNWTIRSSTTTTNTIEKTPSTIRVIKRLSREPSFNVKNALFEDDEEEDDIFSISDLKAIDEL